MTRRILLLVTSFGVLLGACLLYWRMFGLQHDSRPPVVAGNSSKPVELDTKPAFKEQGMAPVLGAGHEAKYVNRDKDGKLLQVVDAKEWLRQDDGSYAATGPVLEMYMKDGTSLYVRGDSGTFFVEEIKGSPKLNHGSLSGNVECLLDRGVHQPKETMAAREEDVVRIKLDDAAFDDSLLTIRSEGQVDLTSYEMDLHGKGLEMALNELPQELRYLKIKQGQSMTIRVESQVDEDANSPSTGAARAKATPRATPRPSALSTTRADKSGSKSKPAAGPRQNQYNAQFDSEKQDICVTYERGSLKNASTLSMSFEWDTNRKSPASTSQTGNGAGGGNGEKASAISRKAPLAKVPTVITWTGPMKLMPAGYVATPDKHRYHIVGSGDKLVLEDPQSKIYCGTFDFTSPQGLAVLTAATGQEVHMVTFDRADTKHEKPAQEIFCREARMYKDKDPSKSSATLLGPGRMLRPSEPTPGQDATAAGAKAPEPDTIVFHEKADVFFGQPAPAKAGKTGKSAKTDKASETDESAMEIRKIVFDGPVEMDRPSAGDHMECKEGLVALLGPVEEMGNQLLSVEAFGSVVADYTTGLDANGQPKTADSKEESHLKAKHVLLDLKPVLAVDKDGNPLYKNGKPMIKPDGKPQLVMKASRLQAFEDVHVERSKPKKDLLIINTQTLDADVINSTASLKGKDSLVSQGAMSVVGDDIFFEQVAAADGTLTPRAKVTGKGRMTLPDRLKPDDKPVQIARMSWTTSMEYIGAEDVAKFDDNVVLDRGADHIAGQSMRVEFQKDDKKVGGSGGKAAGRAKPASSQDTALDLVSIEGLGKMTKVTVRNKVTFERRKTDGQKHLTQLMQLHGDDVEYDMDSQLLTVTRPGTLMVWDLNLPKTKQAGGSDDSFSSSSPAQTAFRWSKVMRLSQKELTAWFDGDVIMSHASGKYLDLKPGERKAWNTLDWGRLEKGQRTALTCDNLQATFEPDKNAAGKAATKPASTNLLESDAPLVTLRTFRATGGVHLEDTSSDPVDVLCELLNYDASTRMADIFGYLPGQPQRKAVIRRQDPIRGPQTESAPEMHWNRDTNKIEARNVSSVGAR